MIMRIQTINRDVKQSIRKKTTFIKEQRDREREKDEKRFVYETE